MPSDLLMIETGSGADLVLRGNDFVSINGYENSTYLSEYGGDNSWWGNYLMGDKPFNSKTEFVLRTTPLTSAGRIKIEAAINADLSYLNNIPGTTWKVTTTITNSNRLDMEIDINGQVFYYVWNPDKLFLTYQIGK